jgi:hypothetical protein
MNWRVTVVLALLSPVPATAQSIRHLALGYGAQSSYQHPNFVTGELGLAMAHGWVAVGALRHSSWNGMSGWRAHVSLQRQVQLGAFRSYFGVGPSWTSEDSEGDWSASEFGAMVLLGLELPAIRTGSGAVRLFGELDGYTHDYATGQALVGLRWQVR